MKPYFTSLKRTLAAGLAGLMLVPASVTILSISDSEARGRAVRGPRGGAAVRGPRGGAAVRTPYGGAAVRTPYGGAAARGRYGGAAVRTPYRGAVRAPVYYGGTRGVARRTARRTTRRIYTLPRGYTTAVIGGVSYYYAGGLYYEPVYEGSTVAYVQVEFDDDDDYDDDDDDDD